MDQPYRAPKSELHSPPGATVLLVDDHDTVRTLVATVLRLRGYQVLEACHGPQALEICARHEGEINLLIADLHLPGLCGVEVAVRMCEARLGLAVLFTSGGHPDEGELLAPGLGPCCFLPKPFHPEELLRATRRALEGLSVVRDPVV